MWWIFPKNKNSDFNTIDYNGSLDLCEITQNYTLLLTSALQIFHKSINTMTKSSLKKSNMTFWNPVGQWKLITHIFSRFSWFTSLSLVWQQTAHCVPSYLYMQVHHYFVPLSYSLFLLWCQQHLCLPCYPKWQQLCIQIYNFNEKALNISSRSLSLTEGELAVWSDSPFHQLDLSLQLCLAALNQEDPASIRTRKVL